MTMTLLCSLPVFTWFLIVSKCFLINLAAKGKTMCPLLAKNASRKGYIFGQNDEQKCAPWQLGVSQRFHSGWSPKAVQFISGYFYCVLLFFTLFLLLVCYRLYAGDCSAAKMYWKTLIWTIRSLFISWNQASYKKCCKSCAGQLFWFCFVLISPSEFYLMFLKQYALNFKGN